MAGILHLASDLAGILAAENQPIAQSREGAAPPGLVK